MGKKKNKVTKDMVMHVHNFIQAEHLELEASIEEVIREFEAVTGMMVDDVSINEEGEVLTHIEYVG
jgi:hypothetical protein